VWYDIRLEYEYVPDNSALANLVGLVVGDSIAGGYQNVGGDGGAYSAYEAWPGVAGLRMGHPIMGAAMAGAISSSFATITNFSWTRLNLATTIPDYAIIALGVNDATSKTVLATYEDNITKLIEKLVNEKGIPSIYLATICPSELVAENEALRVSYNKFLRSLPAGAQGVVELDKQLALQAEPSKVDPAWGTPKEGTPHLLRPAYQRMAGALILP
jgi:lysophospholipase L1-like esterase